MYSHTYNILFFRSVHYTQKEETLSDTPQQMVSTHAMQAIWGGLKRVLCEVENMAALLDDVCTLIQKWHLAHNLESQER